MKKLIFTLALAACSSAAMAAATNICLSDSKPKANVAGLTDGTLFVRATFAPTCSPNTVMSYDQDSSKLWAAAASVKGQNIYGSSTNGGSVGSLGACNSNKTCGEPATVKGVVEGANGLTKAATLGNT